MKYKCVSDYYLNGKNVMMVGDLVTLEGDLLTNLRTNISYMTENLDNLKSHLANITDITKHNSNITKHNTSFKDITDEMFKVYEKKNHDYGNSFEQSLDKFGLIASVVRLSDKMNRIESLVNKEAKVVNESINDTFLDIANYCIMTLMWLNKK